MSGRRGILLVAAALLGLLLVTVGAAYLPLGRLGLLLALAIAATKAGLVAVYYMDLRGSSKLVRVAAGAGLFWFAILGVLTFSDYLTRAPGVIPRPPEQARRVGGW